jgi:hypothetical protein
MKAQLKALFGLAWTLAALATVPALGHAQDAASLMRRAVEAQAERLAGVQTLTIVQEVMGAEMTMIMEKREEGGTPFLVPVSVEVGGMTMPAGEGQADWSNPFNEEWIERTRLVGRGEVDGHGVYVFAMEDFSDLQLPGMPSTEQGAEDFQPKSFEYSLDEDGLFPRKIVMEGEATKDDGSLAPVKMTMIMEDYREVDGYLHPFVTRSIMEGMVEAADMDREELQAQLAEMRAQLESIPEAQRAMVEGMMNAQIERLESMLGSEGGMEMTITVKEVRVNSG